MPDANYWNMLCPDCFSEALGRLGECPDPPFTLYECEPYAIFVEISRDYYKEFCAGRAS